MIIWIRAIAFILLDYFEFCAHRGRHKFPIGEVPPQRLVRGRQILGQKQCEQTKFGLHDLIKIISCRQQLLYLKAKKYAARLR